MPLRKILIAAVCAAALPSAAQTAKQISSLKSQRETLQKKIEENEGMLRTLKKDVRSQLGNLNVLNGQISSQKKLVGAITSDVGRLDSMISALDAQLGALEKDLGERKERYRRSVLYMYRNRNAQNRLMFVFSAGNFTQMYRRMRYVRKYAEYQRIQGELVRRKQRQVAAKRGEVSQARDEKGSLLQLSLKEQQKLESKQAERKKTVTALQKQQRKVQSALQADKKQYGSLNAQIDKLIQRQLAEEKRRREAERKREEERRRQLARQKDTRRKKGGTGAGRPGSAASDKERPSAVFETGKADRALSDNFASNRGKLPAPITGPYMITTHYGQYSPEGLRGVQLDSKGVSITGRPGAKARAVFNGEVSAVFAFGGHTNVLVRHGSYISVYCNLASASVRKGQKVRTRDAIGPVARDATGNCTLHFQLRRETSKLNPESWLNL